MTTALILVSMLVTVENADQTILLKTFRSEFVAQDNFETKLKALPATKKLALPATK